MTAPVCGSLSHSRVPAPGPTRVPAPGPAPGLAPGLPGAMRRAARRVLTVAALALASLLVSGLPPGGRDAPAMIEGPYLLPAPPTVHYLHPHAPNRLVSGG